MVQLIEMPKDRSKRTAADVLNEALEKVEQGKIVNVLVIYGDASGEKLGSIDNGLTISEALFYIELFHHWLMRSALS